MSPTKRNIYLILGLLAIVYWGINNIGAKGPKGLTTSDSVEQAPVTAAAVASATLPHPDVNTVASKPWGADPFYQRGKQRTVRRALSRGHRNRSSYKLKAIIYNATAPSAFLNNRIVRPGDSVDGATVMRIEKHKVVLEEDGKEIAVTVKRR